jgi:hypothetical protein
MIMEQLFTFEFTVEEANLVLAGLGHLPLNQSLDLVNKIQKAAQEQMNTDTTE